MKMPIIIPLEERVEEKIIRDLKKTGYTIKPYEPASSNGNGSNNYTRLMLEKEGKTVALLASYSLYSPKENKRMGKLILQQINGSCERIKELLEKFRGKYQLDYELI